MELLLLGSATCNPPVALAIARPCTAIEVRPSGPPRLAEIPNQIIVVEIWPLCGVEELHHSPSFPVLEGLHAFTMRHSLAFHDKGKQMNLGLSSPSPSLACFFNEFSKGPIGPSKERSLLPAVGRADTEELPALFWGNTNRLAEGPMKAFPISRDDLNVLLVPHTPVNSEIPAFKTFFAFDGDKEISNNGLPGPGIGGFPISLALFLHERHAVDHLTLFASSEDFTVRLIVAAATTVAHT